MKLLVECCFFNYLSLLNVFYVLTENVNLIYEICVLLKSWNSKNSRLKMQRIYNKNLEPILRDQHDLFIIKVNTLFKLQVSKANNWGTICQNGYIN